MHTSSESGNPTDPDRLARDLHGAAHLGNTTLVRSLLALGANASGLPEMETPPLHVAAVAGRLEICELLLSAGADVNARDCRGRTALRWAAGLGGTAACELLVKHGASPDLQDENGSTALHEAAVRSDIATCVVLFDGGAELALVNANNSTPMHNAVSGRSLALCRLFEVRQPGISATYVAGGSTPFQYAVYLGACDIVSAFVLEYGADLEQVARDGRSLSQIAGKNVKMIDLLRALKAEAAVRSALRTVKARVGLLRPQDPNLPRYRTPKKRR
jgi:hypothetical protein